MTIPENSNKSLGTRAKTVNFRESPLFFLHSEFKQLCMLEEGMMICEVVSCSMWTSRISLQKWLHSKYQPLLLRCSQQERQFLLSAAVVIMTISTIHLMTRASNLPGEPLNFYQLSILKCIYSKWIFKGKC